MGVLIRGYLPTFGLKVCYCFMQTLDTALNIRSKLNATGGAWNLNNPQDMCASSRLPHPIACARSTVRLPTALAFGKPEPLMQVRNFRDVTAS